jgi:hypothetical protein
MPSRPARSGKNGSEFRVSNASKVVSALEEIRAAKSWKDLIASSRMARAELPVVWGVVAPRVFERKDITTLGMTPLTILHVVLSLIGIFSGFVVVFGLLTGSRLDGWTALFLATTVATSVTGFQFPFHGFLPSHALGMLSLVVLPVTIYARYSRQLAGAWRHTYVITAMIAFYLNVFVLVAQLFMKVPALQAMAPTQSEPPFKLTQLIVLVLFVVLIIAATKKFQNEPGRAA